MKFPKAEAPITLLVVRKENTLHLNFLVKIIEIRVLPLDESKNYKRNVIQMVASGSSCISGEVYWDLSLKCSSRELC